MTLQIRPATSDDLPFLEQMLVEAAYPPWTDPKPPADARSPTGPNGNEPIATGSCILPPAALRDPHPQSPAASEAVYDPFPGSGTTLVGVETLERRCYGMEIEPRYCQVIVERWQGLTGRTARRVSD